MADEGKRAAPVRESLHEYARGVGGGLLFSLPLLLTQEVWNVAFLASPQRLLAGLLGTLGLLVAFNRIAGLRDDDSWAEVVVESVEELGIGFVVGGISLWSIGRLDFGEPLPVVLGTLVMGTMVTSLGVSVGTAQLGENPTSDPPGAGLGTQLTIAFCGAVVVAGNIAPTREIALVAAEAGPARLLAGLAIALGLAAALTSFAQLKGGRPFSEGSRIPRWAFDPVATLLVAAVAAIVLLGFFGRFDDVGFAMVVAQTVTLLVPAILGAAVGRALLQSP